MHVFRNGRDDADALRGWAARPYANDEVPEEILRRNEFSPGVARPFRRGAIISWRNGAAARPSHVRTAAPLRARPFPARAPRWCNSPPPPFAPVAPSSWKYSRRPHDWTCCFDHSWILLPVKTVNASRHKHGASPGAWEANRISWSIN